MLTYELTGTGLEILKKAGIEDQVKSKWEAISNRLPYLDLKMDLKFLYSEGVKGLPDMDPVSRETLMSLKRRGEVCSDDIKVHDGSMTEMLRLKNLEDMGMTGRTASKLASIYIMSKENEEGWNSRDVHVWRDPERGTKTLMKNYNGYMYLSQYDLSGGGLYRRLGDKDRHLFSGWNNNWEPFLVSLLRYSEQAGCRLKSAEGWRDTLARNARRDFRLEDGGGEVGFDVRRHIDEMVLPQYSKERDGMVLGKVNPVMMAGDYEPDQVFCPMMGPEGDYSIYRQVWKDRKQKPRMVPQDTGYRSVVRTENVLGVPSYWKPSVILSPRDVDEALHGTLKFASYGKIGYRPGFVAYIMKEWEESGRGNLSVKLTNDY